jgi:hypothetical protein
MSDFDDRRPNVFPRTDAVRSSSGFDGLCGTRAFSPGRSYGFNRRQILSSRSPPASPGRTSIVVMLFAASQLARNFSVVVGAALNPSAAKVFASAQMLGRASFSFATSSLAE